MTTFLQIAALCVIGGILALIMRRRTPEFSFLLVLCCCVCAIFAAKELIAPVLDFLTRLQSLAGIDGALLTPIIKTLAVGLLSQLCGAFCLEAGEQSLAKTVELCGTFLALYTILPLAELMLETLTTLMGG